MIVENLERTESNIAKKKIYYLKGYVYERAL